MPFDPNAFDSSYPVPETLGQYTAKTFLWMVLGLLITFAVAIGSWISGLVLVTIRFHWIILIATLVLSFTMGARIEKMGVGTAKTIFLAFSVLFGLTMSIYLLVYDFASLILVFLATAVYFGVLAAYGFLTHRDLSGLRTILTTGLIFLIVCGVILMFVPGFTWLDNISCLIGIMVFLVFTAYDTQMIRSYYHYYSGYPDMMEKAAIFSALQLYLDFINLFLYLLRFLGRSKD